MIDLCLGIHMRHSVIPYLKIVCHLGHLFHSNEQMARKSLDCVLVKDERMVEVEC